MQNLKKINQKLLLEKLSRGDETALAAIYKQYWEIMYLAAFNLVKKKEVCEDIVQEIFVSIWNNRENIKINTSLKSYLYTSTIYKVYDYFRKNSNVVKVELLESFDKRIQSSNPETKLIHAELMEFVDSVIEDLPTKCKEVFKLSREAQLTHKEIAQKLNISQRTVEGHIAKALKILRSSLGNAVTIEMVMFIFHDLLP